MSKNRARGLSTSRRGLLSAAGSLATAAGLTNLLAALDRAVAKAPVANPFAGPVNTGPSSTPVPAIGKTPAVPSNPYMIPMTRGWSATSLLTVGNEVKGYRMSGIPDGLGAFDNGDGTISVLINHELVAGRGPARGHGGKGAFVSRWVMDKASLEVLSGRDFLEVPAKLNLWSEGAWKPATASTGKPLDISRLCAADLAPASAFYNTASKKGYEGIIYLNGEEAGDNSANRAFAWIVADSSAYELPAFAFGKPGDKSDPPPSWENLLAHSATGDATVVIALSDGGSNQVYVYIGQKKDSGSAIEKSGLAGGRIFSFLVAGVEKESRETNIGIQKSLPGKGAGKHISLATPNKGTSFLRPEDGAWDPRNPNVFYFVTTDRNNFAADGSVRDGQDINQIGRSRLWAVTFDDVNRLAVDGTPTAKIEMLLDGTEGGDMFDNIGIDGSGVIYLCEDPGNSRHNGKIWTYDTATGTFEAIVKFDPAKFGDVVSKIYTPPVAPFVDDKESSGVTDVTELFKAAPWFRPGCRLLLVAAQAHFKYDDSDPIGAQIVEGGQLLLLARLPA